MEGQCRNTDLDSAPKPARSLLQTLGTQTAPNRVHGLWAQPCFGMGQYITATTVARPVRSLSDDAKPLETSRRPNHE